MLRDEARLNSREPTPAFRPIIPRPKSSCLRTVHSSPARQARKSMSWTNRGLRPCSRPNALANLLDLTRSLLANHEVKLCMEFLDSLATSELGQVEISSTDLQNSVTVFADWQREMNGHSFGAINLLEQLVVDSVQKVSTARTMTGKFSEPSVSDYFSSEGSRSAPPTRRDKPAKSLPSLDRPTLPSSSRSICSEELCRSHHEAVVHFASAPMLSTADERGADFDRRSGSPSLVHCVTPIPPLVDCDSANALPSAVHSESSRPMQPPVARLSRLSSEPAASSLDSGVGNADSSSMGVGQSTIRSRTMCKMDHQVSLSHDLDSLTREQEVWLATKSGWFVLHPSSPLKICWDTFALLLIIADCITLPLAVGFGVQLDSAYQNHVTVFFTFDLILSFTTGYFHGQLLIMRRPMITIKYLKTWFIMDVVCLIPWDILIAEYGPSTDTSSNSHSKTTILRVLKFGKLFRVVRLTRAVKTGDLLKRLQSQGFLSASLYEYKFFSSCFKMFLTFSFLSHLGACMWNFISAASEDEMTIGQDCSQLGSCFVGSPWMKRYGLDSKDVFTSYIIAFHYMIALLCGGEAPVSPGTHEERIFTIVVLMWAIFITSVVVGEILLIMDNQKQKTIAFDEQMTNARQFMGARQIPIRLQGRVYRYLEAQQKLSISGDVGWNRDFMSALSEPLQIDLVVQLNRRHIRRHPFFKLLDSSSTTVRQICLVAKPYIYAGGDIIVFEATPANTIIFLVRGKVHLTEKDGRSYGLVAPCWHSDRCLFYDDELRTHMVVAINAVETLCLERASLLELIDSDPLAKKHYESYCETLRTSDVLSLRCSLCGERGHTIQTCQHNQEAPGSHRTLAERFRQLRFSSRSSDMVGPMASVLSER